MQHRKKSQVMDYCTRESVAQCEYQVDDLILLMPSLSLVPDDDRTGKRTATSYAKERRPKTCWSEKSVPLHDQNEGGNAVDAVH